MSALLLSACSANRLGYQHAPTLIYYWLDSYFDFDGPQGVAVKDSLRELQSWHRREELPLLADLLKNLQAPALQDVSADQICTLWAYVQERLQAPLNPLAPTLATTAASLKPAQLQHIEAEFARRNKKWREEWLDPSATERATNRSRQIIDRTEQFYGRLDDSQRELIRQQVLASGYDPELQQREMLRRQQDSLQTLARLRSGTFSSEKARMEIQDLFARALASPEPAVRQYTASMTRSLCAGVAAVHNSSSAAQRAKLVKTLQTYEADARALMQGP